jgi:hypothetical protein
VVTDADRATPDASDLLIDTSQGGDSPNYWTGFLESGQKGLDYLEKWTEHRGQVSVAGGKE